MSPRPPTVLKGVATVGVFLLLLAVLILNQTPPARGYEISIYQAYPWFFWILLVLTIFTGQLVILGSVQYGGAGDKSWIPGLGLILMPGLILVFMPYVRGYSIFGRGDVLTHLGYIADTTGVGITDNIYPFTHILVIGLSQATGLEPAALINLLPAVISLVFMGAMVYLVLHLGSRRYGLFCLPFVAIPFMATAHNTAVPFTLGILLTPFALYLFVKEQQSRVVPVRIALILAVVGVVFYHPLAGMFLASVFFLYVSIKSLGSFRAQLPGPTKIPSVTVVVFAAWYFGFARIIRRFDDAADTLLGRTGGETALGTYAATVDAYSPALVDLIRIATARHGIDVLLITLASLFVLLTTYRWLRGKTDPGIFSMLVTGSFLVFLAGAVVFFVNDFSMGFGRPLALARVFAAILAGSLCYHLWRNAKTPASRASVTVLTVGVVFVLACLVVVSAFATPAANAANHQVTQMEIDGTQWVFDNRNDDLLIDEFGIRQYRFEHLHAGTHDNSPSIRRLETQPPDHFGYHEHPFLGERYDEDRYLLITRRGELHYPELFPTYPHFWRYTPEDFVRLQHDPSVSRIYDNGELQSYRISSGG